MFVVCVGVFFACTIELPKARLAAVALVVALLPFAGIPLLPYAAMAALVAAKYYFDRNDLKASQAQLQWVIDRAQSEDLRELARLRLGAVLLDEKSYDRALALADAPHDAAYDAHYAALKGDILVAKNQRAEAKAAYQLALEKAGKENSAFRESVRTRLEALGG